jgi:hypothetical protein
LKKRKEKHNNYSNPAVNLRYRENGSSISSACSGGELSAADYGTNRTLTGYDRVEMDEKYCKGVTESLNSSS